MSGFSFDFLQIDGGTAEPRVFRTPPKGKGHVTYTPHGEPLFYLVGVDSEGYETFLGVYDKKAEALQAGQSVAWEVGAIALYDLTEDPIATVTFAAQDDAAPAVTH